MLKPKEVKVKFTLLDGVLDLTIKRIQSQLESDFDWDDEYAPLVLAKILPVRFVESCNQVLNDGNLEAISDTGWWAELTVDNQVERLTRESINLMKALDSQGLLEGLIKDYYDQHGHFRQQVLP